MKCCVLALLLPLAANAAKPFVHSWDTVGAVLGMHGAFGHNTPTDADVEFIANNYAVVTMAGGCNSSSPVTQEDASLSVARRIKEVNPNVTVGMYFRSDFAMELADCSLSLIHI